MTLIFFFKELQTSPLINAWTSFHHHKTYNIYPIIDLILIFIFKIYKSIYNKTYNIYPIIALKFNGLTIELALKPHA